MPLFSLESLRQNVSAAVSADRKITRKRRERRVARKSRGDLTAGGGRGAGVGLAVAHPHRVVIHGAARFIWKAFTHAVCVVHIFLVAASGTRRAWGREW